MSSEPTVPARLRRSRHLSWFTHMGAVYLFHDLYGYLMEMSPDIAEPIEAFDDGADTEATLARFKDRKFDGADPRQFADILQRSGLEAIDPTGQRFDPELHEAVQRMEEAAVNFALGLQSLRCSIPSGYPTVHDGCGRKKPRSAYKPAPAPI